jgi:hypothetical protein
VIAPLLKVSSILENHDKHLWHHKQQVFVVCSVVYMSTSFVNPLRNTHIAELYHNIEFFDADRGDCSAKRTSYLLIKYCDKAVAPREPSLQENSHV